MPSTVSVVIPAYNTAEFIPDALESVLAQTVQPLEILVVDDGSQDATPQVMRKFKDRVRYIRKERNGPAAARNLGIRSAAGEWIALLDSDDLWLPERLEQQLKLAERNGADLVFCDATSMKEGNLTATTRFTQYRLKERWIKEAPEGLLRDPFRLLFEAGCYILPSTVLIRREALLEAGLFDENIYCNEDMDLWLRLAVNHRFAVVNESLVLRRLHGKNISDDFWTVVTGELKVCESLEKRDPVLAKFDWRPLLRQKKANLYRQLGSLQLDREEIPAARRSFQVSLRCSFSLIVASYWAATFLPKNCLTSLRSWKLREQSNGVYVLRPRSGS